MYFKLIKLMSDRGTNQTKLAKQMGLTVTGFNQKVLGNTDFKLGEIIKVKEIFNLTNAEVIDIFLED